MHLKPRLVIVDGISIRDQLVGSNPMSHELFAVVMRRSGQIDKLNNKDAAGMCWRKFMDPDFAVTFFTERCHNCTFIVSIDESNNP
jgi:hypothetical protein